MSDLQTLYKQAQRLVLTLEGSLPEIEKQASRQNLASSESSLARQAKQNERDLQNICRQLESALKGSFHLSTKEHNEWKKKVTRVVSAADAIASALQRYDSAADRAVRQQRERQELLSHVAADPEAAIIDMQAEKKINASVSSSKRMLNEALDTGAAVLQQMGATRERLKSAQRKTLDVLNTLGLGDSVLRVAERRMRMDRWIVYGGMIFIVLLLTLLWWFFKR